MYVKRTNVSGVCISTSNLKTKQRLTYLPFPLNSLICFAPSEHRVSRPSDSYPNLLHSGWATEDCGNGHFLFPLSGKEFDSFTVARHGPAHHRSNHDASRMRAALFAYDWDLLVAFELRSLRLRGGFYRDVSEKGGGRFALAELQSIHLWVPYEFPQTFRQSCAQAGGRAPLVAPRLRKRDLVDTFQLSGDRSLSVVGNEKLPD